VAGTLFPMPWLIATDPTSGVILPLSKLYFYASGTTTPINTFSDSDLDPTHVNTNPVIANASGLFGPIYVTPGLSYKAVWKTSADVLIRSQDEIPAYLATTTAPTVDNSLVNLRLSLTSGTPVTTADVLAATSLYFEPYQGNRIALYDGSTWNIRTVTAASVVIPATTATLYDVFAYDNAGVPGYELLAWTSDTARAIALVLQDGVLSKSGVVTRRYLGSCRTTAVSGQTEDSEAKRYLWNYYHRVLRPLRVVDTTNDWDYSTAVWRQARATATNQLDVVVGWPEVLITVDVVAVGNNSTAGVSFFAGIGEDSTSALATGVVNNTGPTISGGNTIRHQANAHLRKYPAVGRHTYVWLEYSEATVTTKWYGDNGGALSQSGIFGVIPG